MDPIPDVKAIKSEPDAVKNEAYPDFNKGINFIQVQGGLNLKDEPHMWNLEMPKECVEITIDDICSTEDGGEENKTELQAVNNNNNNNNGTDEYSSEDIKQNNDNIANSHCDRDQFYINTNLNMGEAVIFNDPSTTKYINASLARSQKIPRKILNTKTAGIIRIVAPNEYTVIKDNEYQCTYCKFTTTAKRTKTAMKKHIIRCHQKEFPMFQCPHCPYKTIGFNELKSHLLHRHTSDKDIHWYQCYKCNSKHKTKSSIRQHVYTHFSFEELQFFQKNECSICGVVLRTKDSLNRHIRFVHNKEKLYCKKCNFSTIAKCSLEHHIQVTHTESTDLQTYHCQHCNYKTKFMTRLKAHTRIHHVNPKIICEICGYKCKTQMQMRLHQITHQKKINEKDLKYQCNKCNYRTYRGSNLAVHKLNHLKPSKIKYFYCYHCDFKGNRKDNLKKHIQRHFEKEVVTLWCYICDFSTKRRNLLSEHLGVKHKKGKKPKIDDI
ncbi:unnamed protein product [Ceutorhynchus assimilis]|uniref:C2H2-type domain-containing protein n=1 Tax=Ceutorhynchus assimilis TaxID=467358 RepID=A0A9N9QLB8_9CUCU|nr:unnamed protein product [Ceutorhynchus assimilis]